MTTDLVEKCASDLCVAIWGMDYRPRPGMMPDARWSTALHATLAVIDALADGVSERMVEDACRTYWESINCDGWSWQEMREGTAGNNQRDREVALEHASDIAVAMHAALSAAIRAAKSRETA